MGGRTWHHRELATLERMWPLHSLEEIYAALPGRSRHSINNMACYRKIKRFPEARRHKGRKAVKAPYVIKELRRMREAQGLTRPLLAKRIGVPLVTLAKWEMCCNRPRFEMLMAWSQALGFEIGLRQVSFRQLKAAA